MGMAKPGSQEWENMVHFWRADLESKMGYTKIEIVARKLFKEQGRDFDAEFKKWKEERDD